MKRSLGITLLLIAACNLTTAHAAKPKTQRGAARRGAFGIAQQQVETKGGNYIAGEEKVVLASFRVAFSQEVKASARSSSMFGKGSAATAMTGKLDGVDNDLLQAITDAAYFDFVEKLKLTGITVVLPPELPDAGAYGQLSNIPGPAALDADQGKLLMFAPTGTRLTMFPGDTGARSAFSGFNTSNPVQVFPALIREQQAGVMSVAYYIDFLNADSSGTSRVIGGDAEVSMGQGISVRAGSGIHYTTVRGSQCKGYCPNAVSSVQLGQAVYSQEA